MKSSTGAHYIALDHLRALAAFMVFSWHFTHAHNGTPVSFDFVPVFVPLALFDEGHTGVALFMTLSGYLFAKLLDGRSLIFGPFLLNRALRLLPLLLVVLCLVALEKYLLGENLFVYAKAVAMGVVYPMLPNGGWSVTVEFHFYLILPALLWLCKRRIGWACALLLAAIVLRAVLQNRTGEVHHLAYATIVGRIDQFMLGILFFRIRSHIAHRHLLTAATLSAFMAFYGWFDHSGGFYNMPSYPSPHPIWTVLPALEGLAYGCAIAWYDSSFKLPGTGVSRFAARLGEYSYSIYLLHFFVVFKAAEWVHKHVMDISNFYWAFLWSALFFVLMVVPGYLSFRFIESPFLKLRRPYLAQV